MHTIIKKYLREINKTFVQGDAREESYYKHLDSLIKEFTRLHGIAKIDITILPKKTEAGNPDFRIWDGKVHVTGYIEAKAPTVTNLDAIENSEQLERYRSTFPNLILTNFYEFRLYRNGQRIAQATIARPLVAQRLKTVPPIENVEEFTELLDRFFSFRVPKIQTARALAKELAKRTRFLRDEVIAVELSKNGGRGQEQIADFYEAFKKFLIHSLTHKQFADLYSQTITYGLFAARTRANGDFNRRLAIEFIPQTIGILRDIFQFISLGSPPDSLKISIDDIAEILHVTEVKKILQDYHQTGKGRDPIIHFYETFLENYDPSVRERRGVYYTPEPVVNYIVRAIHSLLKNRFGLADGLASKEVKLLDPAGGTLTFPAKAIRLATEEYKRKYGEGGLHGWLRSHILLDFYAFELMMAPYAVGHLKIGFLFDELGYRMSDDERFQLYLTNTLEMEKIEQIALPFYRSLSEESHSAAKIKKEEPILVILGNPPYSGISANTNKWTEYLLKEDIDGAQSYYKVDGKPLGEKNPKWLQDDYVKFLRFAQWKIQKTGYGIVGMITNHSYLDNPTFRGMRQSLMKSFDEIYIINLHGNSLKKETTPDGGKDENVFDIRQGVSIALLVKNKKSVRSKVFYKDLFGLRNEKYDWLEKSDFSEKNYERIYPKAPYYFFVKRDVEKIKSYLNWMKINEIFPVNSVGIVTSRDEFVIGFSKQELKNRILQFKNLSVPDEIISNAFHLKDKKNWKLRQAREKISALEDIESYFEKISYRPFDARYIFYHPALIERMRYEVMKNMFFENIGLISVRQVAEGIFNHAFVTENIIESRITLSNKGIAYLFPLYLYPQENKKGSSKIGSTMMLLFEPEKSYGRKPNINVAVFEKLDKAFGKRPTPEEIFYYIYGLFYSNVYREKYAEYLKIDFPRVPFTSNYKLFKKLASLGKKLAEIHLLKSGTLDDPIVKYQGKGDNDRIEKIVYVESEQRIYINKEKYFEGVSPDIWNYYIGGYQVLNKYLKNRKSLLMNNPVLFCRIATALSKTIEIQKGIDKVYQSVENEMS